MIGRVRGVQCGQATIAADGVNGYAIIASQHAIHSDLSMRGGYQDWHSSVLTKIMICLAGPGAETIVFGDCDARGDMHMIEELCTRYYIAYDDVDRLQPQVHSLLLKHWNAVERVAIALLEKKTLNGAEIDALFRSTPTQLPGHDSGKIERLG